MHDSLRKQGKPLDGYGIANLSMGEDGRLLIGQLKGGFSLLDQNKTQPNYNLAWNIDALIKAAITADDAKRLTDHLVPVQEAAPPNGTDAAAADASASKSTNMLDTLGNTPFAFLGKNTQATIGSGPQSW